MNSPLLIPVADIIENAPSKKNSYMKRDPKRYNIRRCFHATAGRCSFGAMDSKIWHTRKEYFLRISLWVALHISTVVHKTHRKMWKHSLLGKKSKKPRKYPALKNFTEFETTDWIDCRKPYEKSVKSTLNTLAQTSHNWNRKSGRNTSYLVS